MTDWDRDDEYLSGPASTSVTAPHDTLHASSRGAKMSRRSITPPPKGPSPPPVQSERKERNSKRSSKDITTDDTISILDPRRFTPTLHANLVSEILALRRDQEEKLRHIESLENTLSSSREQQEDSQSKFTATAKENRSLKRQLALLEGGTSSALGELARERDEAVDTSADVKKRLEVAQKKIRTQEEDSQRVHDLWAQDKDSWEEERRKFERKVHVAESRLKVVLDEVAAFQAAQMNNAQHGGHNRHDSDVESGRENDGGSVKSMSIRDSIRFSMNYGGPHGKLTGNTLADELGFEDDDDDDETDVDGRDSVLSHRTGHQHNRNFSRDSAATGKFHQRNQSLDSLRRPTSVARGKLFMNQSVLEALEGEDEKEEEATTPLPKASYTDTGIQFSPPPSPKKEPVKPATPEPATPPAKTVGVDTTPRHDLEIEANQRRKRVQITSPVQTEIPTPRKMVSTSVQTVEEPLSPPSTPPPEIKAPAMVTTSTQTEEAPPALNLREHLVPSPPPPIPSISIQPPTSRPSTPREPRLPPLSKHFGCQVNLASPVSRSDTGVQTEGIKVDTRLAKLPPHLQPSAISSRPSSPSPQAPADLDKHFTPVPGNIPPRNPRRLTERPNALQTQMSPTSPRRGDSELHDVYPGNNDDGPLSNDKSAPIKRPHRFSSLFAGFDTASSDEGEFGDDDVSDSEFRTALSAPRPQSVASRHGARSPTDTITTSPEQNPRRQSGRNIIKPMGTEVYSSFSLPDKENQAGKSAGAGKAQDKASGTQFGPGNRASVMRKAAMIQSGIASHGGRARSPSLPDSRQPPFPIPARASSRKPVSSAPTSEGRRSPSRGEHWQRRNSGRSAYRSNSIRKVRSAAAIPRHQRYRRQGSRSPPPLSPSTEAPESPGLPPLPRNDITTPRRNRGNSHYRRHRHQPSTNTEITNNTQNTNNTDPASVTSTNQTTGVVDAIAQTMIGEWMFKYVRRRKSFNVPESTNKDDSGNDRHKRWVWLAPYERSILWSSKQPSSGSALMGKTGRKLAIQSVLDVKDDNPAPKGETGPVFNRSILILTPQRALKFTATSPERHYVWLTALSFLAHSSQAVPEIVSPGQPPQVKQEPMPEFETRPRSRGRRPGIRDSIRIAKGRTGQPPPPPPKPETPSLPSITSGPSSYMGDMASLRMPDTLGTISSGHTREQSGDAAEPPFIPRFHDRTSNQAAVAHGRKRSNTGGHVPPPLSFRGFSGPTSTTSGHNSTNSTAGVSIGTAGSSEYYQSQGSGNTGWGMSQTASQRTSEASSRPSNFFDAIGTVRMEAFISPLQLSQFGDYPDEQDEFRQVVRRRSKELRRWQSRSSRNRDSYGYAKGRRESDDRFTGSRTAGEEDYFRDDPFRGF